MLTASAVFAIRVTGLITYRLSKILSSISRTRKMMLDVPTNNPRFRQIDPSAMSVGTDMICAPIVSLSFQPKPFLLP